MKRKVLSFFSLLLILLVFLSFISPKVEEEMSTLVEAKRAKGNGRTNLNISSITIIWPNSKDVLFTITEGTGWVSGLRVAELPSDYFDMGPAHISLGPGKEYWYIKSASREPVAGKPITIVETEKGADTYLFWHPESLSDLDLSASKLEILSQTDNAALIRNPSSTYPFFEHNMWYIYHSKLGEDLRIYSLHDIQQFTKALPWIAGVAAVLLSSIILWGGSCLPDRRKGTLVINILLITGLLVLLPWMLSQFDLPASLMPPEFILDLSHYANNFGRITSAMDALGDPRVHGWLSNAAITSAVILAASVLLPCSIIAIEGMIARRREKSKE